MIEAHAEVLIYKDAVNLYVRQKDGARVAYLQPVNLVMKVEPDMPGGIAVIPTQPALKMPREMAVAIMTELWRVGVRPHGVRDDSDRVVVMQAHIDDLRKMNAALLELVKDLQNTV